MRDAGLAHFGRCARHRARAHWAGNSGKRLLIGSHIDTVIEAGMLRWPVRRGRRHSCRRAFAPKPGASRSDVLAFGDEEGVRFPATLASSTACAGTFESGDAGTCRRRGRDASAKRLRATASAPPTFRPPPMRAATPPLLSKFISSRGRCWNIEQSGAGRSDLDCRANLSQCGIFIGDAATQAPCRCCCAATRCPAPPRPFCWRRSGWRAIHKSEVLATVGHLRHSSAARPNVIAGSVALIVDIRSGAPIRPAKQFGRSLQNRIARHRRAAPSRGAFRSQPPATSRRRLVTPAIQDGFAAAIVARPAGGKRCGSSGAGHDRQAMAKLCPSAMLFVRCRGGISHNPAEMPVPATWGWRLRRSSNSSSASRT